MGSDVAWVDGLSAVFRTDPVMAIARARLEWGRITREVLMHVSRAASGARGMRESLYAGISAIALGRSDSPDVTATFARTLLSIASHHGDPPGSPALRERASTILRYGTLPPDGVALLESVDPATALELQQAVPTLIAQGIDPHPVARLVLCYQAALVLPRELLPGICS